MNTQSFSDRKRSALALMPMLFVARSVDAFQITPRSPISPASTISTTRSSRSHLQATPLHDLPIDQLDPQELATHAHAVHGFLQHHTTMLLSDAIATADPTDVIENPMEILENFEATEAAVAADEGWWKAYLNVFKTTLEFVHSGIDGPIHSLGWEGGTWGFSIAVFTACKSGYIFLLGYGWIREVCCKL